LAKKTEPNAPLLIGLMTSKSFMDEGEALVVGGAEVKRDGTELVVELPRDRK
jgi:hypothetical protein